VATSIVGLDIGSTGVRGVELSSNGKSKPTLVRSYEIPLPPGAVIRGEVVEPEVVGAALKRLWSQGGFKSKKVVLGTGNQGVIVRDLTVPKMSIKHIRESLPFQVQSTLQMQLADSLLDFYPTSETVGEQGPVLNGLLVAAEKKEILGNVSAVERAGLTPVEVDLIPFALNRLLISRPQIKGTVALIDIGGTTTSIIISSNGVPWFVRIIPTGGDDLTQALIEGLKIDAFSAEELKRSLTLGAVEIKEDDSDSTTVRCKCAKCIADDPYVNDSRSAEILNVVSGELLGSLRSTVNYFNNTRPQDPVQQILLTGGGSLLSGIAGALSQITHVPVVAADPLSMIALPRKMNAKKIHLDGSIAVALGLAMRSTT
jgi:type IV pilus assembly protein PilM